MKMKILIKATIIKSVCIITLLLVLLLAGIQSALASPPNDFDSLEMYKTYEDGYKAGKKVLKKDYRDANLLEGCIRISDHTLWKKQGWDKDTAKKAEKLYFFGCINVKSKKMTKKEFTEKYVWW
jgi:hypothetical protein